MDQRTLIDQNNIDKVWDKVWQGQIEDQPSAVFKHRLFVEGYPIFSKYIPKATTSILEVGGGTGRYGLYYASEHPEVAVTITDIVDSSLKVVNMLKESMGLKNIKLQKEDARQLSFENNSFDLVMADVVIQHIPDYEKAITEMFRVVKPGGKVIVSAVNVYNPHSITKFVSQIFARRGYEYGYEKSFTHPELTQAFKSAGFSIVAKDGFYFSYGIYRLKYIHPMFALAGRVLNRASKILDKLMSRAWSINFGFEIMIVGEKPADLV
ncbi:methyltransferase domain-containing protein [Candidatus Parcubacteria bacterium]|nr:methyltransferase domain-containing protein [Candidatus Parcubacteria bacterium]